jgi:hypothetical protein
MKLTVNNIDSQLRSELAKTVEFVEIKDNPRGVFLVWSDDGNQSAFSKQTHIIKEAIKKQLPIIIFDKYQKMDADEISFLVKAGAFLWEPAINDRMFFSFQPVWGKIPSDHTEIPWDFDEERPIDLSNLCTLTRKFPSFEQYMVPVHEIGNYRVCYLDKDANGTISNKVGAMDIPIFNTNWNEGNYLKTIKMTVLLGTEQDYKTGNLDPDLFTYLENGVVPLLPAEHRWYHSVFKDLTVYGEDNIDFFLQTYKYTGFGSVYDVYRNLAENLPEADVVNVSKRITSYLKQ